MTLSVLLKVQGYAAQSKSKTSTQMPHLWQSFESSVSSMMMQLLMALVTSFHVPWWLLTAEEEKVQWWARHARTLPNWSAVVRKLLLVQPSSASAERVFSLMNHFFTHLQENALEETVEASVMLRYNNNQRKKIQ